MYFRRPAFALHAVAVAILALPGAASAQTLTVPQVSPAVDSAYTRLEASPLLKKVLADVQADDARALTELKTMTEIPAPPFKERARAEYFVSRLKALGLTDAHIDAEGNAIGIRKGVGNGPKLLISAHLDTVFPEGTDVTVKSRDGKLYAPGIGDDTRGLAVLLSWLKVLNDNKVRTVGDLVFVGNVGEEELGNLRGMKAVFRDHPDIDGMVGLEPGTGDRVLTQGTGSHRYEVLFRGPGGHSFGAFGLPSAIHAMGRAITQVSDVRPPADPKTTFTVGTVGGGTSVNAIAGDARMAVDIRSNGTPALLETEKQIMTAIETGVSEENRRWSPSQGNQISFQTRQIGDRPAGITPTDSVIVQSAVRVIKANSKEAPSLRGGSTDANVPMSLGIPAIILGSGGKSGGSHSRDEWFDPTNAHEGAQWGLTTVLGLVGVEGVGAPLLAKRPAK
ncbi:Acetylornithine deacetylase/Succinyl-diaminopimelate desuccinylase [Cupriavidus sp. YR651]|uniref:M20/M25/M40 family metallo-hydrolase n=1 Tax=Cupriavidus sp. YR651 TaxID=1855315 RepID=UPI0008861F10|nr:M20/M25/M40 family metallo-hydrolase [Cupriavidus sp. YR651]SDD62083.1 Acetylornithine deacetylase/Succinyl-diaminopimelate desuccinylase [Cupriavidus sp. YR651]